MWCLMVLCLFRETKETDETIKTHMDKYLVHKNTHIQVFLSTYRSIQEGETHTCCSKGHNMLWLVPVHAPRYSVSLIIFHQQELTLTRHSRCMEVVEQILKAIDLEIFTLFLRFGWKLSWFFCMSGFFYSQIWFMLLIEAFGIPFLGQRRPCFPERRLWYSCRCCFEYHPGTISITNYKLCWSKQTCRCSILRNIE